VISADLGKMGQIQPKGPLTFRKISADEGISVIKDIWNRLKQAKAALDAA
jgi:allophanate hydrolase subunit 2